MNRAQPALNQAAGPLRVSASPRAVSSASSAGSNVRLDTSEIRGNKRSGIQAPRPARRHLRRLGMRLAAALIAASSFGAVGHALNGALNGDLNGLCAIPAPVIQIQSASTAERPDAEALWNQFKSHFILPGCAVVMDSRGITLGPVALSLGLGGSAWEQSQGIAASLDVARITGNYQDPAAMLKALSMYREGSHGYSSAASGDKARFYDDNGWLGLDFMQAYRQTGNVTYLNQAEDLFKFVQTGQNPTGGMHWNTNDHSAGNMPATGSTTEFALQLYQATHRPEYLRFAEANITFMDAHLRVNQPEIVKGHTAEPGLYWDGVTRSGGELHPVEHLYSYNQGTAIGVHLLMHEITGNPQYLKDAQQTAAAALKYFKGDVLWKEAPVFNAIFFRNLMALNAVAPNPEYRQALNNYLNRVWTEARNPATGVFDQGGIGHYGEPGHNALDQAGLVQLFALNQLSSRPGAAISAPPGLPIMIIAPERFLQGLKCSEGIERHEAGYRWRNTGSSSPLPAAPAEG